VTADRRGLYVLAAIAVALAAVHALAGGRTAPPSRAPFATVASGPPPHELVWMRGPGTEDVRVVGDADGWTVRTPSRGPADTHAVEDILASLRGARWQRRVAAELVPGHARFALVVDGRRLDIGTDVPGAGTWIHEGDVAYLFDTWVATALDRSALDLRVRGVIASPRAAITGIDLTGGGSTLSVAGTPLAVVTPVGAVRLDEGIALSILESLTELRVVALPPDADRPPAQATLVVTANARPETVTTHGPCAEPETVRVRSDAAGDACVADDAWLRIALRLAGAQQMLVEVAEARPAPGPYRAAVLASGARLRWRGATAEVAVAGDADAWALADAESVARVVDALGEAGEPYLLPVPRPAARGTVTVDTTSGAVTLELVGADTVAPAGSPVGIRVAADQRVALALDTDALRDRVLWRTEPSLVVRVTVIDGAARRDLDPTDTRFAAVAEAFAEPRALRFLGPPPAARPTDRVLELEVAPAPVAGATAEVFRLVLGGKTAGGCRAATATDAVVLPPEACAVIETLKKK
jgi:hypothetical protein